MANIVFKNINKVYENKVQAVFDFNLEVRDREFIVLVGPSGCGKSTTLRMLAGLESISSGELYLDGVLINDIAPVDRDMSMVFQNYALYPHMSVYENLAFGLKMRRFPQEILDKDGNHILVVDKYKIADYKDEIKDLKKAIKLAKGKIAKLEKGKAVEESREELEKSIKDAESAIKEKEARIEELKAKPSTYKYKMVKMPKEQIEEKVNYAASVLGLTPYLKRKPANLSGGQRQRVALGRAIVRNPRAFLMDEPLSNLDAKLRVAMRSEIARIHKKVGATTIYVTHDQTEAMTMADRMVVMKDGYIQQIGTPKELYNHPANMFVAGFIGAPSMNFLRGRLEEGSFMIYDVQEDPENQENDIVSETDTRLRIGKELMESLKDYVGKDIVLGIRPEDVRLATGIDKNYLVIESELSELLGNETIVYGSVNHQALNFKTQKEIESRDNEAFRVAIDFKKAHFFDVETTKTII